VRGKEVKEHNNEQLTTKHHPLQQTRNTYNTCITNQEHKNKDIKNKKKKSINIVECEGKKHHTKSLVLIASIGV